MTNSMHYRNVATGVGGVSYPTDTAREIVGRGVWGRCDHCNALAYNMAAKRCHDCGFGERCAGCNTMLRATDPHAPVACSDTCAADLADQTEWARI